MSRKFNWNPPTTCRWEHEGIAYTGQIMRPGRASNFMNPFSTSNLGYWTLRELTKDGKPSTGFVAWELPESDLEAISNE